MALLRPWGPRELLVILLMWALPIWALIDMAVRPDERWRAAGVSRLRWTVAVIFLAALGALLYLLTVRPQLRRSTVSASASSTEDEAQA